MAGKISPALSCYAPAFEDRDRPFVHYYYRGADGELLDERLTRGELWDLGRRAATALHKRGLGPGDFFTLCFGRNHYVDLAFRIAAAMTGAAPVTVNWQADPLERVAFKIELSDSRLILHDRAFNREYLDELKRRYPSADFYDVTNVSDEQALEESDFHAGDDLDETAAQMIVFTSGTTGRPKGVELTYGNYETNRQTFDYWLGLKPEQVLGVIAVNPLHHGNSTSMADYAMRRPKAELILLERYFTPYWKILARAADRGYDMLAAPLVARHFDFLESLVSEGRLPLAVDELKAAMAKVDFLLGSAPVGPATVRRVVEYSGRLPHVRLGATENVLQNVGTPLSLSDDAKLRAFERGWGHRHNGEPSPGYYIGRPHPPLTYARVVKTVDRDRAGFMEDSEEGAPGYLIVKGGHLMAGYVKDRKATQAVFHDGWYIGLGDVCFFLANQDDGGDDIYWMSRESALLIRGGANYACDQINAELVEFVTEKYGIAAEEFDLAVAPLRVNTEYDDDCCVTINLLSERARNMKDTIANEFLSGAKAYVGKGARPDLLRFAEVPRNFKGAILLPELKKEYRKWLKQRDTKD